MKEMNLLSLSPATLGTFDVVLFFGVLYHLRYPFWSLNLIKNMLADGGILIVETAILMDDNQMAMLYCPTGQESPYKDATSCTFFNLKGLSDTLFSIGVTIEQEYLPEDFKSRSQMQIREVVGSILRGKKRGPHIRRATLTCRKMPQAPDVVTANYWEETHRRHTNWNEVVKNRV
jgi:hypothetical protein